MCTSCMEIMTLVHDEKSVPEPQLSKFVLDTVRTMAYSMNKVHISDEELSVFLIILGSSLLVWEDTQS